MNPETIIRERLQAHQNQDQKNINYGLRMVVANCLDLTSPGTGGSVKNQDKAFGEVLKREWEEGRHNPISTNTQVTVENMMMNKPDFRWKDIPDPRADIIAAVRKAYILWLWDEQDLEFEYRMKLMDILTLGEGNMGCFVRGDAIELEWCDGLDVTWDTAYKSPSKRRFVFYDRHLPLIEALKAYPNLAKVQNIESDGRGAERTIDVTCYWDKDNMLEAVMYKNQMIVPPQKNRYGRIPIRATELFREPSVKYAGGIVERQMGSNALALRLQRSFRETALRAVPVGVALGNINEDDLELVRDGEEGWVVRGPAGANFFWAQGIKWDDTQLGLYREVQQQLNEESGVNEAQRNRSDTPVDFASQLAYQAQQSSARAKFMNQVLEEGMRDDFTHLLMPIAGQFENRQPRLSVAGTPMVFDEMMPLPPILGDDGAIEMKPGGMMFKSAAQKLQEVSLLGNTLAMSASLPPGTQEEFVRMALEAYEVEDKEKWLALMREAQMQMAMQEQAIMAANAEGQQQTVSGSSSGTSEKRDSGSRPSNPASTSRS